MALILAYGSQGHQKAQPSSSFSGIVPKLSDEIQPTGGAVQSEAHVKNFVLVKGFK